MAEWTPTMVEDRLESAADVFRSLPEVKPQGYFNAWPEYFHSFADQVGQTFAGKIVRTISGFCGGPVFPTRQLGKDTGQSLGNGKSRVRGEDDAKSFTLNDVAKDLECHRQAVGVAGKGFEQGVEDSLIFGDRAFADVIAQFSRSVSEGVCRQQPDQIG